MEVYEKAAKEIGILSLISFLVIVVFTSSITEALGIIILAIVGHILAITIQIANQLNSLMERENGKDN